MPLADLIQASPPNEGQKQVVKEQAQVIDNQLQHLLSIYDFMQEYNQLDIIPDELHRVLFQRTSLTVRGFKVRMTKSSRASEVLGTMLQTKGYYQGIQEDLDVEEFEQYRTINFPETFSEHGYEYGREFQSIFEESVEKISQEHNVSELSEFYSSVSEETFDRIAKQFDKMAEWYESVLLEEGLISDGKEQTPSFAVLIALCIVYLTGILIIAIGYYEEDAFKILTGMNVLAMGFLAVA